MKPLIKALWHEATVSANPHVQPNLAARMSIDFDGYQVDVLVVTTHKTGTRGPTPDSEKMLDMAIEIGHRIMRPLP